MAATKAGHGARKEDLSLGSGWVNITLRTACEDWIVGGENGADTGEAV